MSDELLMYILIFIRYALPLLVLQILFATLFKKRNKYWNILILIKKIGIKYESMKITCFSKKNICIDTIEI